ncbi:unnamed protein product [Notodromas monacha]|uniref:Angiomotin C-terminal domain-containing protein n=1 Tax=Notodromas monacha TaxID=399045 RepID=A0A7R9BL98_9CRUS|nr:unnamed protein product [Notodromas monacha]CAG0916085.1 unnamed protein product [Notodromas monacha]
MGHQQNNPTRTYPQGYVEYDAVAGMVSVPAEFRRVLRPPLEASMRSANFQQSFSGSETDVSTSTENLTPDEQYFLRHTQRQDPPGEENIHQSFNHLRHVTRHGAQISHVSAASSACGRSYDSSSCNTMIVHSDSTLDEKFLGDFGACGFRQPPPYCSVVTQPLYSNVSEALAASAQEINEIPSHYLDKSEVLKHLAKEVRGPLIGGSTTSNPGSSQQLHNLPEDRSIHGSGLLPPPPAYPSKTASAVVPPPPPFSAALSRSQPDLTKVPTPGKTAEISSDAATSDSKEILDILCQENTALRAELEAYHKKVARLQKFEEELAKVHTAHEALVESSDRRENLEKTARQKLQAEVRRLQGVHRLLSQQLDVALVELNRREGANPAGSVIAQIIAQNRDLRATKERQEVELAAQRDTLQEQRQHIDILDSALTNAQANVVRLEEECHKRQSYAEKVAQLQRALSSLQSASEKREQMNSKLRQQQERENQELKSEVTELREALALKQKEPLTPEDLIDNPVDAELRRAKNRITLLEAEVKMWEQKFLEEIRANCASSVEAQKKLEQSIANEKQAEPSHVRAHSQTQSMVTPPRHNPAFHGHRGSSDAINTKESLESFFVGFQELI